MPFLARFTELVPEMEFFLQLLVIFQVVEDALREHPLVVPVPIGLEELVMGVLEEQWQGWDIAGWLLCLLLDLYVGRIPAMLLATLLGGLDQFARGL